MHEVIQADALQVWHADHEGTVADFATEAKALQDELTDQLRDLPLKDPGHQRLLNALGWHHDRGNLWQFLPDPRLEPTNNRAERAIVPGVLWRNGRLGTQRPSAVQFCASTTTICGWVRKSCQ